MSVFDKIKAVFKKEDEEGQKRNYLSGREIRAIAKENAKVMNKLEKYKHRKAPESEFLTEMKDGGNILEIEDLHTYFFTDQGVVKAVNGVSFNIPKNATVGIVGESGCGKSVTSMSVMRLLQGPQGQIYSGSIRFKAYDYKKDEKGKLIPIFELDENGDTVKVQAKDRKGNPKTDKEGNPVLIPQQKLDEKGAPMYEVEEKVYDIAKMPIKEIYSNFRNI